MRAFISILLLFIACTARSQNVAADSLTFDRFVAQQLHVGKQPVFTPIRIKKDMNEYGLSFSVAGLNVSFEHLDDPESILTINKKKFLLSRLTSVDESEVTFDTYCPDKDGISLVEFAGRKYLYMPGYICKCNGSGCAIINFLIYDISNGTLNGISDFRVFAKPHNLLCNANNDKYLDFISIDNTGYPGDDNLSAFSMTCYFIDAKGKTVAYTNKGKKRLITGSSEPEAGMIINIDKVRWFCENNLSVPLKKSNIAN